MADQVLGFALTNKSRVKAIINLTNTNSDAVIESMINGVTQFIEGQCHRRFKRKTYSNHLISLSVESDKIYLPQLPVISLASFEYAQGLPNAKVWTAVPATDYELVVDQYLNDVQIASMGTIKCYFLVPKGVNHYRATFDAGYLIDWDNEGDPSQHNLPEDLSTLADELVIKAWKRRDDYGKDSSSFNGANIKWMTMLEETHKQVIDRYRRILFT